MKQVLAFLLFSLCVSVQAEPVVPVQPVISHLKLVGRGIVDKKTGDSIALACVESPNDGIISHDNLPDPECRALQFVYFKGMGEAQFVGAIFNLGQRHADWSEEDQIKSEVKHIGKYFKRWRRQNTGMSQNTRVGITYGAFMAMVGAEGLAMVVGTAALTTGVGLAAIPFYILLVPIITGDIKLTHPGSRISVATQDANGWSWAVDPAPVRHRLFSQFTHYLGPKAISLAQETTEKQ